MRSPAVPQPDDAAGSRRGSPGSVQSVARAFELLESIADLGGIVGLTDLAAHSGLPLATIHRLVSTLVDLGYLRQEPSRKYALGPRLIRLGDGSTRLLGTWALPHLRGLVDGIGETANLALLEDHEVVYIAQAPGRHSMRMFTEVGRRAPVHCTAVGKAMLANLPASQVEDMTSRAGMPAQTSHTITTQSSLTRELNRIRKRGYSTDEGEQELGVRCVAVALPGEPVRAAVSISGPLTRMTDQLIKQAVPLLHAAAVELAVEFAFVSSHP